MFHLKITSPEFAVPFSHKKYLSILPPSSVALLWFHSLNTLSQKENPTGDNLRVEFSKTILYLVTATKL